MLRFLLLLSVLEGLTSLSAQVALSCSASRTDPLVASVQAVSELLPDVVIQCRGGIPTPAGQAIPPITLFVVLNTNITSRLLAKSPDLSEALLVVDEPAPENQLPCPTLPCSISGTGGATNPYDGAAGHYNVFQATQTGAN